MIQDNILLIISLLLGVSMLAMLSDKLRISYPIFLVVSGLFISIIPGIPDIQLQPDLVFLIFLPPLLYAAAWNTSWKDFWKWKRPIGLLAFGLVITTACGVAFFSSWLIPNFGLAFGFLLGGIISPPDAVAATTVMQELKLPKRIVTILEGESLVNDAASLIVFRFALAAILVGNFNIWKAEANFLYVVALGVMIGIAIGFVIWSIHRYLPTTPSIDTAVSLMTPYIMYIAAEHFHSSGVLAVVSGGLFLTYRSQDIFSYSSRLQMQHVWDTVVFMLNGVVFILIGLQLRSIINGIQEHSIIASIGYALLITLLVIVIRIAWIFPNTYIPRLLSKRIRATETKPTWQNVLVVGWSGMRGVVSLASGLAIPLTLNNKTPFPHRDLILFITFILILVTLVFQGLTLPWLIKVLKVHSEEDESQLELAVRLRLAEASLEHMDSHYSELADNDAYIRVKERYARMIDIAGKRLNMETNETEAPSFLPKYRQMLIDLVAIKRNELNKMRHNNSFPDELIRKKELELDLEEARLNR